MPSPPGPYNPDVQADLLDAFDLRADASGFSTLLCGADLPDQRANAVRVFDIHFVLVQPRRSQRGCDVVGDLLIGTWGSRGALTSRKKSAERAVRNGQCGSRCHESQRQNPFSELGHEGSP